MTIRPPRRGRAGTILTALAVGTLAGLAPLNALASPATAAAPTAGAPVPSGVPTPSATPSASASMPPTPPATPMPSASASTPAPVADCASPMVLQIDTSLGGFMGTPPTLVEFPLDQTSDVVIDWGGPSAEAYNKGARVTRYTGTDLVVSHVYDQPGTYTVKICGHVGHVGPGPSSGQYHLHLGLYDTITEISSFGDLGTTSYANAFYQWRNLRRVPASLPAGVTTMAGMFGETQSLNQDLNGWDTSHVTDMTSLFWRSSFNGDISAWNTGQVTSMQAMFFEAPNFNRPIGGWDTRHVASIRSMFSGAASFDQDLSGWQVPALSDAAEAFDGSALSTTNYDRLLLSWAQQTVSQGVTLGARDTWNSDASAAARQRLIDADGWTIKDARTLNAPSVRPVIDERYRIAGGVDGPLGAPLEPVVCNADGVCWQEFEHGAIVSPTATSAIMLPEAVYYAFSAVGDGSFDSSFAVLGLPVSEQHCNLVADGCAVQFQKGAIYQQADSGVAYAVYGDIYAMYMGTRGSVGPAGPLGYPTENQFCDAYTKICQQGFQNGVALWSPTTGAHYLNSLWFEAYESDFAGYNPLGAPTSNMVCSPAGPCTQSFEHGAMYAPGADSYPTKVYGPIYDLYQALGGPDSSLGAPIMSQACDLPNEGCSQEFMNGWIITSPTTGTHVVSGDIQKQFASPEDMVAKVGLPTGEATQKGRTTVQTFEKQTVRITPGTAKHAPK